MWVTRDLRDGGEHEGFGVGANAVVQVFEQVRGSLRHNNTRKAKLRKKQKQKAKSKNKTKNNNNKNKSKSKNNKKTQQTQFGGR